MASWEPTQAGLERVLGGAAFLVELADPNNTGTADADIVASYLAASKGEVRSAVQVKHEPESLDAISTDDAAYLIRIGNIIAAEAAWSDGGKNQTMPPELDRKVTWAREQLRMIRVGEARIGRASNGTTPALSQVVGPIDQDPTGIGFSINGMKLGFR